MKPNQIFYVYIDRTNEEVPRVFYVGKGKKQRLTCSKRNEYWSRIADKYGYIREAILGTTDEDFAFQMEKDLIFQYKTFSAAWKDGSGWGANFTAGGEGSSGLVGELSPSFGKIRSDEYKKKASERMSGDKNPNFGRTGDKHPLFGVTGDRHPMFGKKHSDESKNKMSEAHSGEKSWMFGRTGELAPNFGIKLSDETKLKMSKSRTGQKRSEETIKKFTETKRSKSKLKENDVIEIREKYATGNYTQKQLSIEYNSTVSSIGAIINNRMWKNVERKV